MAIEIVTHCVNYSRLLSYQLSGFFLHPPKVETVVTVFIGPADFDNRTFAVTEWFRTRRHGTVTIRPWQLAPDKVVRRAIGRDLACKTTTADIVLMTDCDMVWGEGALDWIAENWPEDKGLCYPRHVGKCSPEHGDSLIEDAKLFTFMDIDPDEFKPQKYRRAIGGTQWVPKRVAHLGYMSDMTIGIHRRAHKPLDRWFRTKEDPHYRRWLARQGLTTGHERGFPLEVPNVYRIRHSKYGRAHQDVKN